MRLVVKLNEPNLFTVIKRCQKEIENADEIFTFDASIVRFIEYLTGTLVLEMLTNTYFDGADEAIVNNSPIMFKPPEFFNLMELRIEDGKVSRIESKEAEIDIKYKKAVLEIYKNVMYDPFGIFDTFNDSMVNIDLTGNTDSISVSVSVQKYSVVISTDK